METRVPSISEDISIARGRAIATRSHEFGDCEISRLEIRDAAASNASRESDFSIEPGDGRKIEASPRPERDFFGATGVWRKRRKGKNAARINAAVVDSEAYDEKHLNKLLLFVERSERRWRRPSPTCVRPLFKRSTSTQLIKYRYNALCGNANWIHVGHAAMRRVCARVYLCMYVCVCVCVLELAPLSLSSKKLMSRSNPCLDGPPWSIRRFSEKGKEKKPIIDRIRSRIDYERMQSAVVARTRSLDYT